MLTFDPLPQARVVRAGGQRVTPPPAPRRRREPMSDKMREAVATVIGLWPITAVALLGLGFFYLAAIASAP